MTSLAQNRAVKKSSAKQPLVRPYVILCLFLVLLTAMTFTLVRSVVNLNNARAQEADLLKRIEEARILTEELMAKKEFMGTLQYVEREARKEWGMSLPGTIRYAFSMDTSSVATMSDSVDFDTDSGI